MRTFDNEDMCFHLSMPSLLFWGGLASFLTKPKGFDPYLAVAHARDLATGIRVDAGASARGCPSRSKLRGMKI